MKPVYIYLALCVLGVVLPYAAFVPWVLEHGVDLPLFVAELFSTRIGAFFGLDVIVSALALFAFIWFERHKRVPHVLWVIPATLVVGVSLGLPLYLALRERIKST